MTSNIRESSICFPKSLYKKTINEILAELKAVVKTGELKVPEPPTRHTQAYCDPSGVTYACQTSSFRTDPVTTKRKGEGTFRLVVIIAE